MPSPNYKYVINLVVSLPIRRGPGVFMNVSVWEHCALNSQIFAILTPLCLVSWCILSFPVVSLMISPLTNFALKSSNRIIIWYLGKWLKTCFNSSWNLSFEPSLFFSVGACAFKAMILHQWPLRTTYIYIYIYIYDILSLTKSTLSTAVTISSVRKILFPTDDFCSLFHRKKIWSPALTVLHCLT